MAVDDRLGVDRAGARLPLAEVVAARGRGDLVGGLVVAGVLVGVDVVLLEHPRVLQVLDGDVAAVDRVRRLAVVRVLAVEAGDAFRRLAAVPDDEHGGADEAEGDHAHAGEREDETPRLRLPHLDGATLALAARVLRGFRARVLGGLRGGLLLGCHFARRALFVDFGMVAAATPGGPDEACSRTPPYLGDRRRANCGVPHYPFSVSPSSSSRSP